MRPGSSSRNAAALATLPPQTGEPRRSTMTYQGGPDRRPDLPGDPEVRREHDYSWSVVPILLGLAVVLGLGYMLLATDGPNPRTTERIEKPDTLPATKP